MSAHNFLGGHAAGEKPQDVFDRDPRAFDAGFGTVDVFVDVFIDIR